MKTFDEIYNTIDNLSEHTGNYALETYGKDLELVLEISNTMPKKVWTVIDVGKKDLHVIAGYHYVNRINYLITKEEWKDENEEYIY